MMDGLSAKLMQQFGQLCSQLVTWACLFASTELFLILFHARTAVQV